MPVASTSSAHTTLLPPQPAPSSSSSAAGPAPQRGTPIVKKVSQRPSLSCVECSRRKTKCDRKIPCSNCLKRHKGHLCRQEGHISKKEFEKIAPGQLEVLQPVYDPRAQAAAELDAFRVTVDTLRSQISSLESLLGEALVDGDPSRRSASVGAQHGKGAAAATGYIAHENGHEVIVKPSWSQRRKMELGTATAGSSNDVHDGMDQYALHGHTQDVKPSLGARTSSAGHSEIASSGTPIPNDVKAAEDLRGQEVEASVALEFMALGRHRAADGHMGDGDEQFAPASAQRLPAEGMNAFGSNDGHSSNGSSLARSLPPNPSFLYPTVASLAAAAPTKEQADVILAHSLDTVLWHHSAVHAPTFTVEVQEFWSWGDERMEVCNPAWLALWFALLVVGVKHLSKEREAQLGFGEDDGDLLSKRWFDCAMACLYRANFLENHSMYAVQTIAALIVTGQDAGRSHLIPTLLTTGISICHDLGYHRVQSDEQWEASVAEVAQPMRVRSLILHETKKRLFWGLTAQDWFSIAYRRTYVVQPTQVTTPLPSNAHDEDLLTGRLVNRVPSEFTVTSKLCLWVQIARCLQKVYEHLDHTITPSYHFLLKVDAELQAVLSSVPPWFHTQEVVPRSVVTCPDWVRSSFIISSNHKVLTLHRPFLHRAFRDARFKVSRDRAITASRNILREAVKPTDNRLWTTLYHTSAAATIICLELFQNIESPAPVFDEERNEVLAALATLEEKSHSSSIARRGAALIMNLLAEEQRLREERIAQGKKPQPVGAVRPRKRTKDGEHGGDFTKIAKLMTSGDGGAGGTSSPLVSPAATPEFTFGTAVPRRSNSITSALGQADGYYSTTDGQGSNSLLDPTLAAMPTSSSAAAMQSLDIPVGSQQQQWGMSDTLPPEFLNIFLESGFDPLDGAITTFPSQYSFDESMFLDLNSGYANGDIVA